VSASNFSSRIDAMYFVLSLKTLTRNIALLHRLLGEETRNPRYIETVATVGYRLLCPVEISEDGSGT
jgi:DNA-binding winged helix-turn-helix (wHTH) protein